MFRGELLKRTQNILIVMGILTMLQKIIPQYEIKGDKTDFVGVHKAKTQKKIKQAISFLQKIYGSKESFLCPCSNFQYYIFHLGNEDYRYPGQSP